MGAVMWIEVLSRHGEVAARERIEAPEARIGRAFDNDVVVDDPHVAPHHLRIFRAEDGELVAEDLGTLNGLYPEHGARRVERLPLAREPGIRIGRTTLRVHDAAHAVAPEKLLTPPRAHAAWAAVLGACVIGALFLLQWLSLTTEASANLLLLPLLVFATLVLLWSGLWALLSRLFFGQARFALQLRIALTACIALLAWDQLSDALAFGLAWRELSEYAALGAWALLAVTCYAHLLAIGPRRMRIAVGVIVALLAAGAVMQYAGKWEARRLVGQLATLGELRPPAFRLRPLASADAFFERTQATRASVDQSRTKEPASGLFSETDSAD
jgi:hypothetical protein